MAIDPSIPLRALTQTGPPVEGPLDQYAKGLSLQNLMRQGQMGNLQLKEAQDQQKEQDAVKQLFQQDMPAEQRLQKLYAVSPSYAAQYQKALADAQNANANLNKTKTETRGKETEQLAAILKPVDDISDPQQKAAAFQAAIATAKRQDLHGPDWPTVYSPELDPVIHGLVMAGMTATQQAEATDRGVRTKIDQQNADTAANKVKDEQARAAAGEMITGSEFTDPQQQRAAWFRVRQPDGSYTQEKRLLGQQGPPPKDLESGRDIPLPAAVEAQKIRISAAEKNAAMGPEYAPSAPGTPTPEILSKYPANVRSLAQQLVAYKIPLPSGFALANPKSPWNAAIQAATEIDPTWNASDYPARMSVLKDFKSGPTSKTITSLNTVIGHLDTLKTAADALDNSKLTAYNSVANYIAKNTGDPRVDKFNQAKQAVADELTRVFRGSGGSESDVKGWESTLNASQSPAQLHGAIDQAIDLLASRTRALQGQWERGFGKPVDFQFLGSKAQGILKKLGKDPSMLDSGVTANPAPATLVNPYRKAQ